MSEKKIFVLVQVYSCLNEGVLLFWDEQEAEAAFREYTGHEYPADNDARDEIPEKLRDTEIYSVTVPECPSSEQHETSER